MHKPHFHYPMLTAAVIKHSYEMFHIDTLCCFPYSSSHKKCFCEYEETIHMINKVVVKFKDNNVLRGQTLNFVPTKDSFHLQQDKGAPVFIEIERLKAIFFVKDLLGNKNHQKNYKDKIMGGGRKLRVTFLDGEEITGYSFGYSPERPAFMMVPADVKGNNDRIFVIKSATSKIEILPP